MQNEHVSIEASIAFWKRSGVLLNYYLVLLFFLLCMGGLYCFALEAVLTTYGEALVSSSD